MKIDYYRNKVFSLPTFGKYYLISSDSISNLKFLVPNIKGHNSFSWSNEVGSVDKKYSPVDIYISPYLGNCFYRKSLADDAYKSKTIEIECGMNDSGRQLGIYVIDCGDRIVIEPNYVYPATVLEKEDIQDVPELAGKCNIWNFF